MRLESHSDIHNVLRQYSAMVYRIAYNRTGNHSDAEDIGQDVFLKLIDKNPDFLNEEERKAWLIRVTMNQSISLWRSSWKRRTRLGVEHIQPVRESQNSIDLSSAMKQLTPKERIVIDLFYYEGYKTNEISQLLGCQHGTIRSRLLRARKKLKNALEMEKEMWQ